MGGTIIETNQRGFAAKGGKPEKQRAGQRARQKARQKKLLLDGELRET